MVSDQSEAPVRAVGRAINVPIPTSRRAAARLAEPPNASSRLALIHAPIGMVTSIGWAGWPSGVPDSKSLTGPAGTSLWIAFDAAVAGRSRKDASSMVVAMVSGFMGVQCPSHRVTNVSGRLPNLLCYCTDALAPSAADI